MSKRLIATSSLLLLALSLPAMAADPHGLWLTGDGQARIRIDRCGAGICGAIASLKEPIDPATGKPLLDHNNLNTALRKRPLIGLRIVNMKPDGDSKWSGTIYNSDDGKTYQASITVTGATALTVRGCVGPFCGDDNWTKAR